jgi:hypothetical protein
LSVSLFEKTSILQALSVLNAMKLTHFSVTN